MPKYIASCTFKEGSIIPDNPGELARYKNSLTDGVRLQMTLENLPSKRSKQAFDLFHALVDVYRKENNLPKERVKMDFKLEYGVVYPIEHGINCHRNGQVVELPNGEFMFVISTTEYSVQEMYALIRGTVNMCMDAQTDIGDIIMEWRTFRPDEVS